MSLINEPPLKKTKHENTVVISQLDASMDTIKNSTRNLKAVLGDEFLKPLPMVKVYVGHVRDTKEISRILLLLNEKIPLKELSHLKRVRKREALLCPSNFLNGMSSIQEYLECNVPELTNVFEYFKEIDVPLMPPKLRSQYNSQLWSCNFHPNKYYEKLYSDNFFTNNELEIHTACMQMSFKVAKWYLERDSSICPELHNVNAAVVLDPSTKSIVAVSFCNIEHPLKHAAMLAIDNVAKTQNGGGWGLQDQNSDIGCIMNGIDRGLLPDIRAEFTEMRFGARVYQSKLDRNDESVQTAVSGPYLCTGYYIYTMREPCLMCAMALVHARVKRVFFCFDNVQHGALKSRTKLHAVPALNHHFEVFTGFL